MQDLAHAVDDAAVQPSTPPPTCGAQVPITDQRMARKLPQPRLAMMTAGRSAANTQLEQIERLQAALAAAEAAHAKERTAAEYQGGRVAKLAALVAATRHHSQVAPLAII